LRTTVVVLAGGKSSRFGSNKLWAPLRGEQLLSFLVRRLASSFPTFVVVKNPAPFYHLRALGAELLVEPFDDYSPLYGLLTGLRQVKAGQLLFLPGDAPFVRPPVLERFTKLFPPPAVLRENGRLHSLFTLLSKEHLPAVEEALKKGVHRLSELHRLLDSREVPFTLLKPLDYGGVSLLNLNRMEDYLEAASSGIN